MPEITVTETQRARLDEIQSDIAAAYVDTYGHIRTEDVLQYLLDTYTPPEQQPSDVAYERIATAEFPLLQQVATDVEGVPGSGIDTETMRGELLSALGVEAFAARLAALDGAESVDDTEAADTSVDDTDESGADDTDEADPSVDNTDEANADDTAATAGSDDTDDAADSDQTGSASETDDPGSILSAANQLLTDHDDKWRKGGGNEPYEVDLPDGTTESVRTKDDIRQILFKHY
jgi:hypothetical protein